MKVCILGPDKRTETEVKMIEEAKKIFDSVLYIPYTEIGLSSERIEYKVDISSFDALLPRIKRDNSLFAYILLNNLKSIYSPITPDAYLFTHDRFLMLEYLKRFDIDTPKIYLINSRKSLLRLKNLEMPLAIRSSKGGGIMFATNKTELKTMVDALGYSSPIYLEEFYSKKYMQVIVIGRKVFCIERKPRERKDIYLGKGEVKAKSPGSDIKEISMRVADALDVDFVCVTVGGNKVYDVTFTPDLSFIGSVLGENLIYRLLKFVKLASKGIGYIPIEKITYDFKKLLAEIFR